MLLFYVRHGAPTYDPDCLTPLGERQAESVANLTVQSAHTAYAYGVSGATNSLNEFWGVLEEYQASPDVVRARIYREKMVRALSTIGKIRVVTDDDSKIVISGE
jgi:hypothetical protein